MPTRRAVHVLFFLSGVSGLVYQVVWVRQLGQVFGNTVYSAAIVTAAFMCGLGVGSYAAGAFIDARSRDRGGAARAALVAYGVSELLIASLGLAIALGLPHLASVTGALSSYEPGEHGWHRLTAGSYALRYALAVVMLAPITALMGGTLPLLVRYTLAGGLSSVGRRVGALYGVNTAGAAVGCLASDALLVPRLGLSGAQLVAIAFNALAGVGALALARTSGVATSEAPSEVDAPPAARGPDDGVGPLPWVLLALGLSGFAGMGLELSWFRHLSAFLGHTRSAYSLLLTVVLTGLWIGAVAAGRGPRHHAMERFIWTQALLAVSALALLWGFDQRMTSWCFRALGGASMASSSARRVAVELFCAVAPVVAVAGVPSVLMGASFPLANAAIQDLDARVGRRTGALYLANTAGALLGSLAAAFVLIPALGLQATAAVMAGAGAAAILPAYAASRGEAPGARRAAQVAGGLAAAALVAWLTLPGDHLLRRTFALPAGGRLVARAEGAEGSIAVVEDPSGARQLYTNAFPMSATTAYAQRYMRAFVHVPLLQQEAPRSALVICFGVGNTASALTLHPSLQRIDVADLSELVLGQAGHFRATNLGVLGDPRVQVFVNDGRLHLRMVPEQTYDLITLEPPPIADAGVSALYSREFYALARSRLREGGFVTQWLPIYQVEHDVALSLVRTFVDAFPGAVLLSGEQRELILVGKRGGAPTVDLGDLERRLAARPAVRADLLGVGLRDPVELVGTFVSGGDALARAVASAPPMGDDRATLEYASTAVWSTSRIPSTLFALEGVTAFCPACFQGGAPVAAVAALPEYQRVLGALYRDPQFLAADGGHGPPLRPPQLVWSDGQAGATIARHPYLSRLFGSALTGAQSPPPRPLEAHAELVRRSEAGRDADAYLKLGVEAALARQLDAASDLLAKALAIDEHLVPARFVLGWVAIQRGRPAAAIEAFERGVTEAPGNVAARLTLAAAYDAGGQPDRALRELEALARLDPDHREARAWLCAAYGKRGEREAARPHCERARALDALWSARAAPP